MERISVYVVDLSTDKKKRKYLYFQWIDPTTGKRKTKSSKCKTKREAERAAKDFEDKLNRHRTTGDGSLLWDEFVTLYTEEHLSSLEFVSQKRVISILNIFKKISDPQRLSNVTTAVLSAYATKLRSDKWKRSEATIAAHLSRISTAMLWAKGQGYVDEVPRIPKVTRARSPRAKGRPLTGPEFVKFLRSVSAVVGRAAAKSWRRLLIGLWLSGLRLDEALNLTWNYGDGIWIDTSGEYPLLGVSAESEKGKSDRLLPLTPDFARWLMAHTPEGARAGSVFPLVKQRHKDVIRMDHVSKVISEIGEKSGIVVSGTGKFCSSHDLRRSFGLRWAQKVMPADLQQLMRHADISTTLRFYAISDAQNFAARLWSLSTPPTTPPEKDKPQQ